MEIKRSVAVLALSGAALAGGVMFGPVLAGAQEEEQEDAPEQAPSEDGNGGPCRGPLGGGKHLEVAAQAIGIEVDALREALQGGQTMAQVAEANGVAVQTVIDALVADANARLDEAVANGRLTQEEADARKAELVEHITARVNGETIEGGPERPLPGGPPPMEDGEQQQTSL